MNVLIVCSGPEIVRMLTSLVEPEGHRVFACTTAAEAQRLSSPAPFGALVVDGLLPDGGADAVVRGLQSAGRLSSGAPILVLGDRADADIQSRMQRIPSAVLMWKPASLLDIVERIRRADAASAGSAARVEPMAVRVGTVVVPVRAGFLESAATVEVVDDEDDDDADADTGGSETFGHRADADAEPWNRENVRMLSRWWARRATGAVRVDGGSGAAFQLSRGGLVGGGRVAAVESAMRASSVVLDPCDVVEPGDRGALAQLLWRAATQASRGEDAWSLIPLMTSLSGSTSELTVHSVTRRCLARSASGATVDELAREEEPYWGGVAGEIAALAWMGLIGLEHRSKLEPLQVAPSRGLADVVWSQRPVERPFDQAPAPQRSAHEVTRDAPTYEPPPRPYVEHTTDGPTGKMHAPAVESVDDPITSATAGTVLLRRLNREVGVLRSADAWTVLGIARRSTPDAIQVASQRMQHRYRAMSADPAPDVSTLAAEILARVQAAEAELLAAKAAHTEGPLEGFLRRGQEELARGDWARADRYFSQARQAAPDHPLVLAHLGWARFHHPARPKDSREEEGTDYIELALQFDIDCAQAWQYRGEIAALRNDIAEARACFATATKLDPTFTGRRRK